MEAAGPGRPTLFGDANTMPPFFPYAGPGPYVRAACDQLGLCEFVAPPDCYHKAMADPILARLSGLVAQAIDPAHAADILGHAKTSRDALAVAALAAEEILVAATTTHDLPYNFPLVIAARDAAPVTNKDTVSIPRAEYEDLVKCQQALAVIIQGEVKETPPSTEPLPTPADLNARRKR
jgi:hypothetical protein